MFESVLAAIQELRSRMHPEDEWAPVGADVTETARLFACPLGGLVTAIGDTPDLALQTRRWGRLCVSVCRRVQACWEFRCDIDPLTPSIQTANDQLFHGAPLTKPVFDHNWAPSYRGQPLPDDCNITCPNLVALAVIWCRRFAVDPQPNFVIACVREADRGMSESELAEQDQFRQWVLEFAVPAAWDDRELTPREQEALRSYNIQSVRHWRDKRAIRATYSSNE